MPERFAMKISEELLTLVAEMTGETESPFEDDSYIVIEPIDGLNEFNLKIMSEDSVFEEFKKDNTLHIL
jgi:hypothetical protein